MQTRRNFSSLRNFLDRRVFPVAAIAALALPLAACNAPRIESPVEQAGPCRAAYSNAVSATSHTTAGHPFIDRYLSAGNAAQAWRYASTVCSSQFSVYAMKSTQMQWLQKSLSPLVGANPVFPNAALANLNNVIALRANNTTLGALALAEDRAGFEIEVLAARGVPHATLQLSDNHKAIAARLISLEAANTTDPSQTSDPRQKVYDVANLIAHPDTIMDPSTGLQASTVSVVEMDCARESLIALQQALPVSNKADDASSSAADDTSKSQRSESSSKSLAVLSDLIASRAYLALSLGYPAFDNALFE